MSLSNKRNSAYRFGHQVNRGEARRKEALAVRRKKKRIFAIGLFLFVLCALSGLAIWATHRDELRIQEIVIEGTTKLPEDLVRTSLETRLAQARLHVFGRDNAILFSETRVAMSLKDEFPRIQEVDVQIEGFVRPLLRVVLSERIADALWCAEDGTCFFMDSRGFIFAFADGFAEYVQYKGGEASQERAIGSVFAEDYARFPVLVTAFNRTGNDTKVAEVFPEHIALHLTRGFSVYVKRQFENPDVLSETLGLVLASDALRGRTALLEYVDLRFGNRVYYKFIGEDPVGPEIQE